MAAYTTIDDPSAYFKVQLYTGNGSANHAITFDDTDTDMQPDMVWIKNRDATDDNCAFDAVRGATKLWLPNDGAVETTDTDTLDSFASDGFQVDADVKVNTNTEKYVSWNWKAGTTSGIATDGNETLTLTGYSFNQTAGFSIIHYTGNATSAAKFSHGLAAAPHWMMIKNLDSGEHPLMWHHALKAYSSPEDYYMTLNEVNNAADDASALNDTLPDTVNVTLGDGGKANGSGHKEIAYIWTGKQGYSKFGTYEGNGNADGTFVYTGFRPAYIFTVSSDSTSVRMIFDKTREGFNVDNDLLSSTDDRAETTTDYIDILSNGFKMRISSDPNVAETYAYCAWAEAPFVNSNGVPCNAR